MAKECVHPSSPQQQYAHAHPRYNSPQPGGSGERRPFLTPRRSNSSRKREKEYESDPHRLAQRQRQILYGENTPGYRNFIRLLEKDPALLQGCLPLKPSIVQKCSKRSWDGQVRKWRRALHMYDFVDFGEDEQESIKVRDALVEQTKNPLFITPKKAPAADGQEVLVTSIPKTNPPLAAGEVVLPSDFDLQQCERVRYTFEDLLHIADSQLISTTIKLPEALSWLDKRVDLEDDVEDDLNDSVGLINPAGTPHKSSSSLSSSSYTPLYARSSSSPSSSTPGPAPTPLRGADLPHTPASSGRFGGSQPLTPTHSSSGAGLRTPQREGRPLNRIGSAAAPQSSSSSSLASSVARDAEMRTPVRGTLFAPTSGHHQQQQQQPVPAAASSAGPVGPISPLDFLARHAVQEVRTVRPVPVVPVVPQLFPTGEAVPAPQFFTPTRAGITGTLCGFRPVSHAPAATPQQAPAAAI